MKRFVVVLAIFAIAACGGRSEPTAEPTQAALVAATATEIPAPTATQVPTATATQAPTNTPEPTATPKPTATPEPTSTPTPPPTATAEPTSAPASSGPVDVVEQVFGAVSSMNVEPAMALFCEAKAPQMAGAIGSGFEELVAAGLDPEELAQAFALDLQDMAYQEISRDGDAAVVNVTGTLYFDFDPDALKEVITTVAESNGQTLTEQELGFVITLLGVIAEQGTPLDADVQVLRENGQWVVCDDMLFLGDMFELPMP